MSDQASSLLKKSVSVISQMTAMEQSLTMLDHGSRLFTVQGGWQSNAIKSDPSVISCETLLELESAVRDPEVKVIFMSYRALIMPSDVETIIRRNGATKTLFKEVIE